MTTEPEKPANPYKPGDTVWGFRAGSAPTVGPAVVVKATANQVKLDDRHEAFGYRTVVPPSGAFPTRAAALKALVVELGREAEKLAANLRDKQSQRARFVDELAKEQP